MAMTRRKVYVIEDTDGRFRRMAYSRPGAEFQAVIVGALTWLTFRPRQICIYRVAYPLVAKKETR